MVLLPRKLLFEGSRGGPTFSRGGGGPTFFPGGVQMVIPIETHITCDFPGGGGGPDPLSPLWIRTCFLWVCHFPMCVLVDIGT